MPHPVPHPIPCPIPCPIPSPAPSPAPSHPIPSCAPFHAPSCAPSHLVPHPVSHAASHPMPNPMGSLWCPAGSRAALAHPMSPNCSRCHPGAHGISGLPAPRGHRGGSVPPPAARGTHVFTRIPKATCKEHPYPNGCPLAPWGHPCCPPLTPIKPSSRGGGAPWLTPCSPSPAQPQNPREIPQSWHVLGTRGEGEGGWEQRGRPPQWGPMAVPTDVTLVPPRAGGARC